MESQNIVYERKKSLDKYDFAGILKYARKVSKERNLGKYNLKIAVTGSYALQFFAMALKAMLLQECVNADVYEGHFNGVRMDLFNYESQLYQFNPDIVIILMDYKAIKEFPDLYSENGKVDEWVNNQLLYYQSLWKHIQSRLNKCHIFQSNIVLPIERVIGNLECNYYFSRRTCLSLLNIQLTKQRYQYVTMVDLEYVASNIGKNKWFDDTSYMLNKSGFALQYIGVVCDVFVKQIEAYLGKVKKCLVLDLDNTLWGGSVGEDGYDGIVLDPNDAVGESYLSFQKYILGLKRRGVILAVCSKNDYEVAREPFIKNEQMILKLNDISSFICNWDNKVENIKRISLDLNIGTDSFVFFDDSPAERESVKIFLPEVEVIDVPNNVADYVKALEMSFSFDWLQITKEDLQRNDSYCYNKQRNELQKVCINYDEYLKELNMYAKVNKPKQRDLERFTQLVNKSNQFNLRTQRYTEAEIMSKNMSSDYILLIINLSDKFENYGIISCVILRKDMDSIFIDTWVMSCRVLKRKIEYFIFEEILNIAKQNNEKKIVGEYITTERNSIVSSLYYDLGFEKCSINETGTNQNSELYMYDTKRDFLNNSYIKRK